MLEGLNAMHKQGFCHRSVKPENIKMIQFDAASSTPLIQLVNSEFATPLEGYDYSTKNMTLGHRFFISPEMVKKETHDSATDIWALGITAYYLLTYGKCPFRGPSINVIDDRILNNEPDFRLVPFQQRPKAIEFIKRCLSKDKEQRPSA